MARVTIACIVRTIYTRKPTPPLPKPRTVRSQKGKKGYCCAVLLRRREAINNRKTCHSAQFDLLCDVVRREKRIVVPIYSYTQPPAVISDLSANLLTRANLIAQRRTANLSEI